MIGLKNIQAFVAIVEEKSFTKAAERLFLTQPALSKQIKILERYFGAELLERGDKEVTLTEAGQLFYPEAQKILHGIAQTRESIGELQGLLKGHLLLGASSLPGDYILPEIIGRFRSIHPHIDVELKIGDTRQIIADLKSRVVQIGFLGAYPQDPSLDVYPYLEDELVLIVPPLWPDCEKWVKIWKYPLILREKGSGTRQIIEDYLQNITGYPGGQALLELGSTRAIINAVAAGWGCSFVSRWAARDSLALGKIKEDSSLQATIRRLIYISVLRERSLSSAAQAFWRFAMKGKAYKGKKDNEINGN